MHARTSSYPQHQRLSSSLPLHVSAGLENQQSKRIRNLVPPPWYPAIHVPMTSSTPSLAFPFLPIIAYHSQIAKSSVVMYKIPRDRSNTRRQPTSVPERFIRLVRSRYQKPARSKGGYSFETTTRLMSFASINLYVRTTTISVPVPLNFAAAGPVFWRQHPQRPPPDRCTQ